MSGTRAGTAADFHPAPPRDRRLRLGLRLAQTIRVGTLTVILPDGGTHRVERSDAPAATMRVHDPRMVRRLVTRGTLGLAEAYLEGWWESPDIRAVMTLAAANNAEWRAMLQGRPWMRAVSRAMHKLRANSRRGARRNIADHYDLGNDFYSRWLDSGMTYSAALFDGAQALDAAQEHKMRRLCDMLELRPGMRLLEIGCGWGSFAELAARDYGVHVTGLTLSERQLDYARARAAAAGLAGRIDLRLQDYRDVAGQFDRIASIEMFEAVGEEYWAAYFATLRDRLVPGGLAGLQTITIADRLFPDYRRTADFIQRHVFPGGMLPSLTRLHEEIARGGLKFLHAHWFGRDYAETLARWQAAFQSAWPDIARLHTTGSPSDARRPYDARFKRLWEFYLSYCETGFTAGWTDVGQILLARPA